MAFRAGGMSDEEEDEYEFELYGLVKGEPSTDAFISADELVLYLTTHTHGVLRFIVTSEACTRMLLNPAIFDLYREF